jgi:hypothetical protein
MVKDSAPYLQRQLGRWRLADARHLLGESPRHRLAYDESRQADGDIYAFNDPTRRYREFELDFDKETGLLRGVFIYPWKMRWNDARKIWDGAVSAEDASNGRKFYSFADRRLDVLVDRAGYIVSLGLY